MTGSAPARCPRCAALARPGSQWCTLCYADLRPAPPQPAPAAAASSEMFDPLTAPLALLDRGAEPVSASPWEAPEAGWPCATCGATVALDQPSCPSCGAGFLEGSLIDDPVLGRLSKGSVSNQTKALIMIGGSLGLLVLCLAAMYILGAVF